MLKLYRLQVCLIRTCYKHFFRCNIVFVIIKFRYRQHSKTKEVTHFPFVLVLFDHLKPLLWHVPFESDEN